jgi:hypothetical protein
MSKYLSLLAVFAAASFSALLADFAHAQATRTWVSGVGDDLNPCSRTAPCKTFAGAISKTAAGGEINCTDPGAFGAVTITKSITISCEDLEAGVLASLVNGVIVNAGVNDIVTLRGLDIEGFGNGLNGIRFLAGAALHVQDVTIRNFRSGNAGQGNGIIFAPSGNSFLYVSDSIVSDSLNGILIQPTGAGSAEVVLERVSAEDNGVGIDARTIGSTGAGINLTISNSTAAGSTLRGVGAATMNGPPANVMVIGSSLVNNNGAGASASGANAIIRIGSSVITGNQIAGQEGSGGQVLSYGNNQIAGNTQGALPSTTPLN